MWSVLLALYFRSSCVSWKSLPIKQCWSCCCWCCCCCFLLLFLLVVVVLVVLWPFESHRLESTKHFFNKKSTFWLSSKSSQSLHLLGQLFLCIMWIIIEIFAKRSRSPGSSDMEKSLQSCCGPFRELEKLSKCIKLGKTHTLLQKNSIFLLFFFDLFLFLHFSSIDFVFVFDSCRFFPFSNQIWQNPKMQKNIFFFSFLSMYFRFFSFVFVFSFVFLNYFRTEKTFSNYFRIAKTLFTSFSNYFRIKGEFLNCLRTWNAHMDCIFTITGAIAQWSWRPWQDLLRQAITVVLCEHSVTMEN